MKRTRPERPSGRPRFKFRRACLRCGRNMKSRCWKKLKGLGARTDWFCEKCGLTYSYKEGILREIGDRRAKARYWGTPWTKVGTELVVMMAEEILG